MSRTSAAVALVVACAAVACDDSPSGPSQPLTGTWGARGVGHSGQAFELVLEQSGETVTGRACGVDGGVTLFHDAPVSGRYPRVSFVVTPASAGPCCAHLAGTSFSGRQDDTRDIVGTISLGFDLRFTRGGAGGC